ncbi:cytochrome c maturation protein CcmE [Aquisalimonas lutea]|uniref:cytochrome c maturation protein CcmE n=1 Tax=Aquisalimonas lutea TaxID=1327750 RepID=UPI0025B29C00|nr:cytochrome c maturation protein CcmE [Aquisalimonas lutea]MDN3519081.1 cytochrome c maturation protein CcmE [Aquisalimonas lutea]
MTVRQRRATFVLLIVGGVMVATALALSAFRENMLFFFDPSQVVAGEAPTNYPFRLGGLVRDGSLEEVDEGLMVRFSVTDGTSEVPVTYEGVLPDLFREGQGVVVRGTLREDDVFVAEEVLAKHDENYMPPEVADSLRTTKPGEDRR